MESEAADEEDATADLTIQEQQVFTSKLISRMQDGAEAQPKKSGSATPGQPIISKI